jgi:Family of unknown function (DUF5985)
MRASVWGVVLAMRSVTAALLFVRFCRESRERLFGLPALAFAGLAANWTGLGIIDKNRRSGRL